MKLVITALKTISTKLLTEKVLIAVFLHIAEHLASKSENDLDDVLVEELKEALK